MTMRAPLPTRRRNCRHQIGERLARAGAGFDDQVSLLLKRAQHRRRHFDLAGPVFVFRMSLGDQAFRPKDFLH